MKEKNWPIIIGLLIIGILMFIIIFEDAIIRADPFSIDEGIIGALEGEKLSKGHPFPPNLLDKYGTDPLGRNVHSLLIFGTKVTIGVAALSALFRILIAAPIAFYSGIGGKISSSLLKFFSTFFNIVPEIIIGYIVLNQEGFLKLSLGVSMLVFSIVMAVTGWGKLGEKLYKEVRKVVDGEEKTNVKRKYVFKQVFPHIFANFFTEIGNVLTSLCVLGVLGITIGVNKFGNLKFEGSWGKVYNYYPEWSGMLNITREAMLDRKYWLPIFPLLGFTFSIIGFNLLGEGFLYEIRNDEDLFYKRMKTLGHHLSPKTYFKEWENFSYNKRNIVIKSLVIIIIFIYIVSLIPTSPKGIYRTNSDNVVRHVEAIRQMEEINEVGNYIEKELKEIGVTPIFETADEKGKTAFSFNQEYNFDIDNENISGKNIAGYLRGYNPYYPLIIVADYGYMNNTEDGRYERLDEGATSIGVSLELVRVIKERYSAETSIRSIVFLFVDGSQYDGIGAHVAMGTKNIGSGSFYMYFNCLGAGESDKLYLNTSTVSSRNTAFYKQIKRLKNKIKQKNFKLDYEYFGDELRIPNTLFRSDMSGIIFSGIPRYEYLESYYSQEQRDSSINTKKLGDITQTIMEIIIDYAWGSPYGWRYLR